MAMEDDALATRGGGEGRRATQDEELLGRKE
jgi:hypothetical protein